LASGTLEDLLRNLERYLRVVTEAIQVRLTVDGETARLEGVGDRELLLHCGQAVEFATSLLLSLYRTSTGRHIKPIEIRFSHRREDGVGKLKRILDCPVRFSCGRFEQILDRSDLAIPIPSSDQKLLALLKKHPRRCYRSVARTGPICCSGWSDGLPSCCRPGGREPRFWRASWV
jgi:hypothetical protein